MMLVNEAAEKYAEDYSATQDALLQKILLETAATHTKAHMVSGKVQGLFLEMLCSMLQPKMVLEIGSFTGYSALCMAAALPADGMLHTIEIREADALTAQQYFNESIYKHKINLHVGNALSIIEGMNYTWDLVFIDADKASYINYYELTLPRLRKGGIIIADNVLFHGQVLDAAIKSKNAKAIQAFNEHVKNDSRVQQVMLTVRDGLTLIKKK